MSNLPNDSFILLSYINTKLRDYYKTLDMLCEDMEIEQENLIEALRKIDYEYDTVRNQFI